VDITTIQIQNNRHFLSIKMATSVSEALFIIRTNFDFMITVSHRFFPAVIANPVYLLPLVVSLGAYVAVSYLTSPWRRLPPGPVGYPFIGSALRLLDRHWLVTKCKAYGKLSFPATAPLISDEN
jgi:hypothetical protein